MYKIYTSKHCYIPASSLEQAQAIRTELHAQGYIQLKIVKLKDSQ
jgi:hypothetical protein